MTLTALAQWGLTLQSSGSYLDAPQAVLDDMPTMYRLIARYAPWLIRHKLNGYRISTFELVP